MFVSGRVHRVPMVRVSEWEEREREYRVCMHTCVTRWVGNGSKETNSSKCATWQLSSVCICEESNSWSIGITALLTLETTLLSSSICMIPTGTTPWAMSVCYLCHRILYWDSYNRLVVFQVELKQMIVDANGSEKHISAHVSQCLFYFAAIPQRTHDDCGTVPEVVERFWGTWQYEQGISFFRMFNPGCLHICQPHIKCFHNHL